MKIIYVAGPFRGKDSWEMEQNIRRAEELALMVWRSGAAALCPHTNTRFFQGAASDDVWLEGDLELLSRCDGVIMTDDWQRSEGARQEHASANRRGMPIFYSIEKLQHWLDNAQAPKRL